MTGVDDEIGGRGARLKAAFPGAYHQDGAFVSFDAGKIKDRMGWRDATETRSGVKFTWLNGEVWLHLDTKVGNVQSAWSWRVTEEEWTVVIEAMAEAKAFALLREPQPMTQPDTHEPVIGNCPECDAPIGEQFGCIHWPAIQPDTRTVAEPDIGAAFSVPDDGKWYEVRALVRRTPYGVAEAAVYSTGRDGTRRMSHTSDSAGLDVERLRAALTQAAQDYHEAASLLRGVYDHHDGWTFTTCPDVRCGDYRAALREVSHDST